MRALWLMLISLPFFIGCAGIWGQRQVNLGDTITGIYRRKPEKSTDRLIITDAKERAITYVAVDLEQTQARRVRPRRVVCVEPSPDVATAVSDAIQASLKAQATKPGVGEVGVDAGI